MNAGTPEQFDAIIIGVGQAGKPLALAFSEKGWKTAIIERKFLGGSCINYGCTPTKTLIASAQVAHQARRSADYGVNVSDVQVDYPAVKQRKDQIVEKFRNSIQKSFDKAENLTLIWGEACFTGPKEVMVALTDGGSKTLTAEHIFIDTGSSTAKPDIPGLEQVNWLTSTSLMELDELPKHLVILGGGYIGLEFSQMFRRFGSQVTLIERGDQILSQEDKDVADEMTSFLQGEGIEILVNAEVESVHQEPTGAITVFVKAADGLNEVTGTHLLVATGGAPNTAALTLDAAGIETDEQGYTQVNERLETSQPGIYALGDVKGGPAFTHISYDDYRIVRQNLLEGGNATITGRPVPYAVFTDPQLGRIGLSEKDARQQGHAIKIAKMPMSSVGRAVETGQANGFMKVIVDADTGQLLGAAMLGMEGGELMTMIQIAMMGNLPYTSLRDAIFAHPTLAESLNNVFATIEE